MAQNGFVLDSNGAVLATLAADVVSPQYRNGLVFDGVTGALSTTGLSGGLTPEQVAAVQVLVSGGGNLGPVAVQNVQFTNLKRWRAARAKVQGGASRAIYLSCGDSTTAGFGALSADSGFNSGYAYSVDAAITAGLTVAGVAAQQNCFFGTHGVDPTERPTYDSRIALNGWIWDVALGSVGGRPYVSTTTTQRMTFASGLTFDSFRVFSAAVSRGVMTVDVDSSPPATGTAAIDQSAYDVFISSPYTTTLATHTVGLTHTSGASVGVIGIEAWNSGVPAVSVIQGGQLGAKASDINNPAGNPFSWNFINAAVAINPDIFRLMLTENDVTAGTDVETWKGLIRGILTPLQALGTTLLLEDGFPASGQSAVTLAAYKAAVYALALEYGAMYLPMDASILSYEDSNALGLYFDGGHPNRAGYALRGRLIGQMLATV